MQNSYCGYAPLPHLALTTFVASSYTLSSFPEFQQRWLSGYFLNTLSMFPPQGLCTCLSLFLKCFLHALLHLFKFLIKCHVIKEAFHLPSILSVFILIFHLIFLPYIFMYLPLHYLLISLCVYCLYPSTRM